MDLARRIAWSIPPVGRRLRPIWVRCESAIARRRGQRVAHFIHIGKTGGTALRHAVHDADGDSRYRLRFWGHTFRLCDVPRGDVFFFFVRDPIDRFVSAFVYRAAGGSSMFQDPWTVEERRAFERFQSPDALASALFSDPAAEAAMGAIEHVRDSFWDWFGDKPYFESRLDDLLLVGRQESLESDTARLAKLIGKELALPTDRKTANRADSSIDRTLSPKARANLVRWYEADYGFIDLLADLDLISTPCARDPKDIGLL